MTAIHAFFFKEKAIVMSIDRHRWKAKLNLVMNGICILLVFLSFFSCMLDFLIVGRVPHFVQLLSRLVPRADVVGMLLLRSVSRHLLQSGEPSSSRKATRNLQANRSHFSKVRFSLRLFRGQNQTKLKGLHPISFFKEILTLDSLILGWAYN